MLIGISAPRPDERKESRKTFNVDIPIEAVRLINVSATIFFNWLWAPAL